MKQVQILIDSACDMQQPEAERLGVTLLPLRTSFDGEVFLDGVDLSHEAFFEKLTQSKTLPTTSQVPPYDYEKAYRQAQKAGREILVITISSRLSGTYQSAVIAAQQTGADVTIVDSENVTAGERVLVDLAIRLRDEGLCAKDIAKALEQAKSRLCILGRVDTLEYLYRGGQALQNRRARRNAPGHPPGADGAGWRTLRPRKGERRAAEQQFSQRGDCKARRN